MIAATKYHRKSSSVRLNQACDSLEEKLSCVSGSVESDGLLILFMKTR